MTVLRASALLLLAAVAAGCRPSCGAVCTKVRGCELTEEQAQQECEYQCSAYAAEYETDDAQDALWVDHLQCVQASSCEELRAGACHDALFGY